MGSLRAPCGSGLQFTLLLLMTPPAQTPDILFYDGHCGLCHSAVKFVVKQDRSGKAFRFAPLYGKTFEGTSALYQRRVLCDSMVVQTCEGLLLMRSNAFIVFFSDSEENGRL